ncbi:MAG TPA: helix-turn-helix domain-containing protein [Candidatus Coprenecus stercoravium]|uniref:Helix-turn-helix domain-containing protein n=1 Tax=Candidatus Coprenecus stercoravium TaxID=2840735 RepID=A0A9D2GPG4_9BACT|nr:helix-turn-helix domain-containing protein [Candidatus Coprenecus stercoravium]
MNRRLQQFLELEQLKPAQFADIMGIQRANVSHILSGRNKPSFDFIQKFLNKFPSVNPDWLLLGKGKPLREQNSPALPTGTSSAQDVLFTEPDEAPEYSGVDMEMEEPAERKDVRRITLFYSDGTFQEFYPPK